MASLKYHFTVSFAQLQPTFILLDLYRTLKFAFDELFN